MKAGRVGLLALLVTACGPSRGDTGARPDSADGAPDDTQADSGESSVDQAFGVLSLNLHCLTNEGTDFDDNQARFAAIAQAVAAEDVQVIALQELCVSQEESAPALLEAALEGATGLAWELATTFAHTGWEGTDDEADEYVGLAVLGGLLESRDIELHVQEGLRRVGVQGRWDSGFAHLAFTSVHLDHQHAGARLGQARQSAVEALISASGAESLVLGDLNDVPGSDPVLAMEAMGFVDLGADLDDDRIDYVFAHRGAPLELVSIERIFTGERWPEVSDHPGMLARVRRAEAEPVALTTVTAEYPDDGWLALRGDQAPLGWDVGWPASQDERRWTTVFSELEGSFEYKWLRGDVDWQLGDNRQGQAAQVNESVVAF